MCSVPLEARGSRGRDDEAVRALHPMCNEEWLNRRRTSHCGCSTMSCLDDAAPNHEVQVAGGDDANVSIRAGSDRSGTGPWQPACRRSHDRDRQTLNFAWIWLGNHDHARAWNGRNGRRRARSGRTPLSAGPKGTRVRKIAIRTHRNRPPPQTDACSPRDFRPVCAFDGDRRTQA